MVAVRLSDVQPDDKATRVTYGLLNLTHRDGHAEPRALEPAERFRVRVRLNDVAQRFPAGHRLRISLSTSYFPLAWPPPEPVRLTVHSAACRLHLPCREAREENIAFAQAEGSASGERTLLRAGEHNWRVVRDLATDRSTLEVVDDHGSYRLEDIDLTVQRRAEEWYSYQGDDFSSPRGATLWTRGLKRGDWSIKTVTRSVLSCDTRYFYLTAELDAYEDDKRVYSQNWDTRIARNLV
jgi:hypothetical protein